MNAFTIRNKARIGVLASLLILALCLQVSFVFALEDFTTYTELDPNSNITVYDSTNVKQHIVENEDAYLYDDKDANYFDDFEHTVDARVENRSGSVMAFCWALTNVVDDRKGIFDADGDYLTIRFEFNKIAIEECAGGSLFTDIYSTTTTDKWYYFRIYKLSTVFNVYVYNNTARTAPYLEDTLSLTLHTPPMFRYVFATWLRERGNSANYDLLTSNLDLGFVPESTVPQYNLMGLNSTLNGSGVQFTFNLTDDTSLDIAFFQWNNSGTNTNVSYDLDIGGTGTPVLLLLVNQTLNTTTGVCVYYRLFFNDTSNNWNSTIQHFLFTNTKPIVSLIPAQLFIGALILFGSFGGILILAWGRRKR